MSAASTWRRRSVDDPRERRHVAHLGVTVSLLDRGTQATERFRNLSAAARENVAVARDDVAADRSLKLRDAVATVARELYRRRQAGARRFCWPPWRQSKRRRSRLKTYSMLLAHHPAEHLSLQSVVLGFVTPVLRKLCERYA